MEKESKRVEKLEKWNEERAAKREAKAFVEGSWETA